MDFTVVNTQRMPVRKGGIVFPTEVPVKVPISFLREFALDRGFRYDFSQAAEYLATRSQDGRLRIDWRSPLSDIDGYGRHAIWLLRALRAADVDLIVRDIGWVDNLWLPQDIRDLRAQAHRLAPLPSKIGLAYTVGYDPQLTNHPSLVRVAMTLWETDHYPEREVANVNRADHCIVGASFCVRVFRDSGVTTPISVMTPGIQTELFPVLKREQGPFRVLLLGALTGRKNPVGAIRMFQTASRGSRDWRMTIKTRYPKDIPGVKEAVAADDRVSLVLGDIHPQEVLRLYEQHDCLLWPSKGEGIGLPPLEAMSTGMEVVSSTNSGLADFITRENAWPIANEGKEPACAPGMFNHDYVKTYGDVGSVWTPSEEDGGVQLRKCFEAWAAGKGKGARAARHVRRNHDISRTAQSIIPVLERFA